MENTGKKKPVVVNKVGANGGGKADKGADYANYFSTYAFLYHLKEMLSDRVRMDAYYHPIFENTRHFKGKVGKHVFLTSVSRLLPHSMSWW